MCLQMLTCPDISLYKLQLPNPSPPHAATCTSSRQQTQHQIPKASLAFLTPITTHTSLEQQHLVLPVHPSNRMQTALQKAPSAAYSGAMCCMSSGTVSCSAVLAAAAACLPPPGMWPCSWCCTSCSDSSRARAKAASSLNTRCGLLSCRRDGLQQAPVKVVELCF